MVQAGIERRGSVYSVPTIAVEGNLIIFPIFLTSALLKLYVEEEGRELVLEAVGAAELTATSTVAYAEARAGLARRPPATPP